MTKTTDRRAVQIGKLMAAASVLGLSLGMNAQAADTGTQHLKGEHIQIKGEQTQIKGEQTQIKGESSQPKYQSNQHKWTGFLKTNSGQQGASTQIKLDAPSSQHKHDTPSSELNPQPEPPKPVGTQGQTPH